LQIDGAGRRVQRAGGKAVGDMCYTALHISILITRKQESQLCTVDRLKELHLYLKIVIRCG